LSGSANSVNDRCNNRAATFGRTVSFRGCNHSHRGTREGEGGGVNENREGRSISRAISLAPNEIRITDLSLSLSLSISVVSTHSQIFTKYRSRRLPPPCTNAARTPSVCRVAVTMIGKLHLQVIRDVDIFVLACSTSSSRLAVRQLKAAFTPYRAPDARILV